MHGELGMIYMEPSALGWKPLLLSWMSTIPANIDAWLTNFLYESLFLRFCTPLFRFLRRGSIKVYIYYSILIILELNRF